MCGDLDNQDDSATLANYRSLAARHLRGPARAGAVAAASPSDDLPAYMGALFQNVIGTVCADAEASEAADNTLLIAQSVVLARAAGILAAQSSLTEDPLRQIIEALMDGYAGENGAKARVDLDHHHHGPGSHDHDHGQGVSHSHDIGGDFHY